MQAQSPGKNEDVVKAPRVSVVVPAFNHEKFVGYALRSVLGQTFQDFELIVIDDGSTDRTWIETNKISDPRIRRYTQENIGAARTINRGIELSRGEFISVLNSDDVYHPDRLLRFVALMDENPDCMIAASLIRPIDESGRTVPLGSREIYWREWYDQMIEFWRLDNDPGVTILRGNFVATTSNIFARSQVFRQINPFEPLLAYCHDYEFLLRAISDYPFAMIDEELLDYRLHSKNTIKENDFLKHLEVLYSVFTNVDLERLLARVNLQERISDPLFKSLLNNREINPEKYHSEYLEIILRKEEEISKAEKKLSQADKWLKDRKREATVLEGKLSEANEWVRKLKKESDEYLAKLNNSETKIRKQKETIRSLGESLKHRESVLQEIYHSKGWLWLTRYRRLLYEFQRVADRFRNFMMAGPRRLRVYRKIRSKWKGCEDIANTDRPDREKEMSCTQQIKLRKPVAEQRPVVVHAIANFMTGGSSRLVADLIEHLGHLYQQEVVTFFNPDPPAYSGFPIREFPRSESAIRGFLKERKASMVHVHYWGECDDPWYRCVFEAARKCGCVVVENINTPVEAYIDGIVDHYVYVSEYAKNFGSKVGSPSSVIYPGSNLEMFKRNGEPAKDDVIGMVYRLENDKLGEDSIQVFIEVVKRRPSTKAVIVGGGSFLESYRKQVSDAGVLENFLFTDYVPYSRLPDYYRRFSIFVAPVKKESFGQVSPFAMGMELPVAGYDVGALSEILNGGECLGRDCGHLAEIIIGLLEDKEKRLEIGRRNRERALENFTVEAMVGRYNSLYQKLLKQKQSDT